MVCYTSVENIARPQQRQIFVIVYYFDKDGTHIESPNCLYQKILIIFIIKNRKKLRWSRFLFLCLKDREINFIEITPIKYFFILYFAILNI